MVISQTGHLPTIQLGFWWPKGRLKPSNDKWSLIIIVPSVVFKLNSLTWQHLGRGGHCPGYSLLISAFPLSHNPNSCLLTVRVKIHKYTNTNINTYIFLFNFFLHVFCNSTKSTTNSSVLFKKRIKPEVSKYEYKY